MEIKIKMHGTVKFFTERGWGFIEAEDGYDYFILYKNIVSNNSFKTLKEGQKVLFDPSTGRDGKLKAENLVPIE